jgi:hypothetical protein
MGRHLVVSIALVLSLSATSANAQGAAMVLNLGQSIRSAGMGGAGEAVFWGDLDTWANPALMGYQTGGRYTWGATRLVPELASDVFLRSERFSAGIGGLGWTRGRADLSYGVVELTDPGGNPIGTAVVSEYTRFTGFGVSASSLLRGLAEIHPDDTGALARLTKVADVAFGLTRKEAKVELGPERAVTTSSDWGLLLRGSLPRRTKLGGVPWGADVAYGHSVLNYDDASMYFPLEDASYPVTRMGRDGWAVRGSLGMPAHVRGGLERALGTWLGASFEPLASLAVVGDHERSTAGGRGYDVSHNGEELALANVFHLRRGHITDRDGEIDGTTTGWGVGFTLAGVAGWRYDEATVPQARNSGLSDRKRTGWTAFVDPVAICAKLR